MNVNKFNLQVNVINFSEFYLDKKQTTLLVLNGLTVWYVYNNFQSVIYRLCVNGEIKIMR